MYRIIHLFCFVTALLLTGCSSHQKTENSAITETISAKTEIQKTDVIKDSKINNNSENTNSSIPETIVTKIDKVTEQKPDQNTSENISFRLFTIIVLLGLLVIVLISYYKKGIKQHVVVQSKTTTLSAKNGDLEYNNQIIYVHKLLLNVISELKIFKNTKSNQNNNVSPESNSIESIAGLSKQLSTLEKESQKLSEIIVKKSLKSTLGRVCSAYETANFIRKSISSKKMSNQDSVDELLLEIESLFNDVGLQIYTIEIGKKISELPYGSFEIIGIAEIPNSHNLAGTVKEVISSAVYVTDSNGQPHFVAPAKIKAYKL